MSGKSRRMEHDLVLLRVRSDTVLVSQGDTVLATGPDGMVGDDAKHGLYVHETRLLSLYRWRIGGRRPHPAGLSRVAQHRWLGYYILGAPGDDAGKDGGVHAAAQQTLEMRVARRMGESMHEDIDLANHTQEPVAFRLAFDIDGDFADIAEASVERQQHGTRRRRWQRDGDAQLMTLDYRAEHEYAHPDERGTARIERSLELRIEADSPARHQGRRVWFDIALEPHASWHACFTWSAVIDGRRLSPPACGREAAPREECLYLGEATQVASPESGTLAPVIMEALAQARADLAALRLHRLDRGPRAWTVSAGVPVFMGLFGRDSLVAAWQSAPLGPELLRGTLPVLAEMQGDADNRWRDEAPGRMLHEAHTGPLGALRYKPNARDYFELSASALYPFAVAQRGQWTGDRAAVAPLVEPALRALRWLDREACDPRGFYAIATRSPDGIRNQAWKDSDDALVDEDGRQVEPPVATCEEQGMVFAAKLAFAEVLWAFDRKDEARRLAREAQELKQRFNDAYWCEDTGFYAMGITADGRVLRTLGSNALHCLATGIADQALAPRVVERLFRPDLFSGWGIRTLSADNPAYNPFAYHRGTVWPAEHGPFAIGAYRYDCIDAVERVCKAMSEAAALFEFNRLPECFGGHPRDAAHPFPALYPAANVPQAWSASTMVTILQAKLGLQPYAPYGVLFVDPHMPEWLPEVTLHGLRVGQAVADLRFFRCADGSSSHEVLRLDGELEVREEPTPWALTASWGPDLEERLGRGRRAA